MLTEELKDCMQREADLLARYVQLEEKLPAAYLNRNWQELEGFVAQMGELSRRIEGAEKQRDACYRSLKESLRLGEEADFHRVLRGLSREVRKGLGDEFLRLKCEVVRVRSASARLGYYFRTASETINGILAELLPYRKGKLYSRRGKTREAPVSSLVVDHKM